MGMLVTNGARLACTFGTAPSSLVVMPAGKVLCGAPAASILDMKPVVNILPFGLCNSMANPQVAAATAAALGVLTPMPCVPVPTGPWAPGSASVLLGGSPALNNACTCSCAWAGVISILSPGQLKTTVGS